MSIFSQKLADFYNCSSLHPHLTVIEAKIILSQRQIHYFWLIETISQVCTYPQWSRLIRRRLKQHGLGALALGALAGSQPVFQCYEALLASKMVWWHPSYFLGMVSAPWLGFVGRVLVCLGQKCGQIFSLSVGDWDSVPGNDFPVVTWPMKTVTLQSEISGNGVR